MVEVLQVKPFEYDGTLIISSLVDLPNDVYSNLFTDTSHYK